MTYPQILFALGLVVIALCTFLTVRIILDMRQRIVVSVQRPTTVDGETCVISANIRAAAGAQEIAAHIEKASLAIQGRMVKQNEIIAQTDANVAHQKWIRIRAKLDAAEKEGRRGVGVLSKQERLWWTEHAKDFDQDGPIVKADRVAEAAHGDKQEAEG